MKWYGVVKGYNRFGEQPKRKVMINIDTNDIKLAGAVIVQAGYFNKQDAMDSWNEWVADTDGVRTDPEQGGAEEHFQFYNEITTEADDLTADTASITAEEWTAGIAKTKKEAERQYELAAEGEESEWDEAQIAPRADCLKLQAEAEKKPKSKTRRTDRPLKGHSDTADKFLEVQKAIEELDKQAAAIRAIIAEKQLVSGNLASELINYAQEYQDRMFRTEKILIQLQDIPSHKAKVPQWRQVIDHLLDKLGGVSTEMRQEGEDFIEASKREIPGSTELYYQEVESSITSVMGEAWAGFRKILDKVKSMGKVIGSKLSGIEKQTNELLSSMGGADSATA